MSGILAELDAIKSMVATSYGHLPADRFPGPPTMIVERLARVIEALSTQAAPTEARRKLPGLPMEIQEWCWHMDLSVEQDDRHAAMALRAAWPAVSNWLQHNVGPTVADPKDQTFPSPPRQKP